MKTLAEIIHDTRLEKGFTLRSLAEKAKVSAVFISDIENEHKVPTKGDGLKNISRCLDLNWNEVLTIAQNTKLLKTSNLKKNKSNDLKMALARNIINSKNEIDSEKMKKIIMLILLAAFFASPVQARDACF